MSSKAGVLKRSHGQRFGTEPIPKDRGHRFQYAALILMAVFFTVYALNGFPGKVSPDVWNILFMCLWMMIVLGFGETIRRLSMFGEEICHCHTRYFGQYMQVVKKVFIFNTYSCILIVPAFLILLFVYIVWPAILYDIMRDIKLHSILLILIVYPVFSLGDCTWNKAEEFAVLEKAHILVGNGLAWGYYTGYLKLVLPCKKILEQPLKTLEGSDDFRNIRNLRVTASSSRSVTLEWESPKNMTDLMSHYFIAYSVIKKEQDAQEGDKDVKDIKWINCPVEGHTKTTVQGLSPYTDYIFQVSTITIDGKRGNSRLLKLKTHGDIRERMERYEEMQGVKFPIKKLFILVPESCYIPAILGEYKDPDIEHAGALEKVEISRAGNVKRVYQNPVYRIRVPKGEAEADKTKFWYVAMEGCTPILTLYEMASKYYLNSKMSGEEKICQLKIFLKVFYKEINKMDPDCNDLCDFIYYKDKDQNGQQVPLSKIIRARILELQREEVAPDKN